MTRFGGNCPKGGLASYGLPPGLYGCRALTSFYLNILVVQKVHKIQMPEPINKVLPEHSQVHSFYLVYRTTIVKLSSCHKRPYMAHKPENIYFLALDEKTWPTAVLSSCNQKCVITKKLARNTESQVALQTH